jgi:PadR family transcriptional regulator, regulatory protein PadR
MGPNLLEDRAISLFVRPHEPIGSPHRLRGVMTGTAPSPLPLLQGSLDLLVLGAVASRATHGYGIATRIRERSRGVLEVEDAALYQALHRLERQGLLLAEWGLSENNRRARYYSITPSGRKRLREEAAKWEQYADAVAAVLAPA